MFILLIVAKRTNDLSIGLSVEEGMEFGPFALEKHLEGMDIVTATLYLERNGVPWTGIGC